MQAIRLSVPSNRGTTDIKVDTFISTIGSERKREYTDKLRSGIFTGNVTQRGKVVVYRLRKQCEIFSYLVHCLLRLLPNSTRDQTFCWNQKVAYFQEDWGGLWLRNKYTQRLQKKKITIYFLFIGRPFCDLISEKESTTKNIIILWNFQHEMR